MNGRLWRQARQSDISESCVFPTVETQKLRFTINDAKACPLLSNVEIYRGEERNIKTSEEQATLHSGQEKSEWKVLSKGITPSDYLLDGNYQTVYRQAERSIVVDLTNKLGVKGFQYLPNTEIGSDGLIFEYKFEVSEDGKRVAGCERRRVLEYSKQPCFADSFF